MEAVMEEQLLPPSPSDNKDLSPIAKGKRTKRFRPHSPSTVATPYGQDPTFSPASSEESTTTSEVDMARCLILLSRGYRFSTNNDRPHPATTYRRYTTNAAARGCTGGAYTCKTCGRSFPSFQALGGHRTSHKKPKNDKKLFIFLDEDNFPSPKRNKFSPNSLSLQLSNISSTTFSATPKSLSPRMHECSYCGAEFTSGQALGGHMRKHRGGGFITRSSNISPPDVFVDKGKTRIVVGSQPPDPAPEDATQEKNTKENIEATAGLTLSITNSHLPPNDHDCY